MKISIMSGLSQSYFINIGKSFYINEKTECDDFIKHYLEVFKILKDKHYMVTEFDIFLTKIIDIN